MLRPFPLAVMALAIVLVLFALTMARLSGGEDVPGGGGPRLLVARAARAPAGPALVGRTGGAGSSGAPARAVVWHALAARGTTSEPAGEDGAGVEAG